MIQERKKNKVNILKTFTNIAKVHRIAFEISNKYALALSLPSVLL